MTPPKKPNKQPASQLNDEFAIGKPQQKQVPLTDESYTAQAVTSSMPVVAEIPKMPAIAKAFAEVGSLTTSATALVITNDHEYEVAAQTMMRINSAIKELEDKRGSLTKKLTDVVTSIRALFKPKLEDLESAKKIYRQKLGAFDDERIREAERKRLAALQDEARKKKDLDDAAERERTEAAERQRLADEENARLQAIAADAENAANAATEGGDTESAAEAAKIARRARAEQLRLQNRKEEEQEATQERLASIEQEQRKVYVPTPAPPAVPKVAGIKRTTIWKWELRTTDQLVRLPDKYWLPRQLDKAAIDRDVQQLKESAETFFGGTIRVWSETSIAGDAK